MSYLDIHGHFDFEDIYSEAVATAPRNAVLVEVGVMFGRSLMYLSGLALSAGRGDIRVVGVDPWIVDPVADINPEGWGGEDYSERLRSAGGDPMAFAEGFMQSHTPDEYAHAELWRQTSVSAAAACARNGVRPWMVFVDGDHRYEAVKADIEAWRPLVAPGGILAGHDWPNYETVRRAVVDTLGADGFEVRGSSWFTRTPV